MAGSKYTQSQETKDKRAASIRAACAKRGKLIRSPEWIAKQKAAQSGKVQSVEAKAKKAETMRKQWADPEERTRRIEANRAGHEKRKAGRTTYRAMHLRLMKIEKPKQCQAELVGMECCNVPPREWALKHDGKVLVDESSGLKYSDSFADYVALCTRCHRYYDGNLPDWTRRLK